MYKYIIELREKTASHALFALTAHVSSPWAFLNRVNINRYRHRIVKVTAHSKAKPEARLRRCFFKS